MINRYGHHRFASTEGFARAPGSLRHWLYLRVHCIGDSIPRISHRVELFQLMPTPSKLLLDQLAQANCAGTSDDDIVFLDRNFVAYLLFNGSASSSNTVCANNKAVATYHPYNKRH